MLMQKWLNRSKYFHLGTYYILEDNTYNQGIFFFLNFRAVSCMFYLLDKKIVINVIG